MRLEIQAHGGNDRLTLRRVLAAGPSSVAIDFGGTGLTIERTLTLADGVRVVLAVPATPSPREFARVVRPYLDRVAVASFDERVLDEIGHFRTVETTLLFSRPLRVATAARTIGPRQDLVCRELVDSAHALGVRVVPWTVNDVRRMAELVDLGVDGLVTDEPALARAVAQARLSAAA